MLREERLLQEGEEKLLLLEDLLDTASLARQFYTTKILVPLFQTAPSQTSPVAYRTGFCTQGSISGKLPYDVKEKMGESSLCCIKLIPKFKAKVACESRSQKGLAVC